MSATTRLNATLGVEALAAPRLVDTTTPWSTGERQVVISDVNVVAVVAYLTPAEVRQVAEAWTALADQLDAESGPRGSALGADTHLRHARICHCLDESDRCCQPSCDCHDEPEDS